MKKIFILFAFILSGLISEAQVPTQKAIMIAATASVSANYSVAITANPGQQGTIFLTTSATFTATATSDTIQVGYTDPGDGSLVWTNAYTSAGAVAVLNPASPSITYQVQLFGVLANYYRIKHVGATNPGTLTSVIQLR